MPGLVPSIREPNVVDQDVDGRDKPGHDGLYDWRSSEGSTTFNGSSAGGMA